MAEYQVVIAGRLADAFNDDFDGWVGINEGRIACVGQGTPQASLSETSKSYGRDFIIIPGLIDAHVHCREPGNGAYKETYKTIGLAAAHGGVTTIATMPNLGKGYSLISNERLRAAMEIAKRDCMVDVRFWAGLSPDNLGNLKELAIPGVVGFKGFTTGFDPDMDPTKLGKDERRDFYNEAMKAADSLGKMTAWHAEDEESFEARWKDSGETFAHARYRRPISEYSMARELIGLARGSGSRIHLCHASTRKTFEAVREYGGASTEVTPHHSRFSIEDMRRDRRLRMNPPLRSIEDSQYSRNALFSGSVGVLSSDHAPHRKGDGGDDEAANPCGVPYLDKAGSLLANWIVHGLNARRAAHISSHGPAKLMGLDDRGLISEGMRADLAVLRLYGDGRSDKTYSLCGWTPYGYVQDFVEATIIGGKVVFERGEPVGI